MSKIKTILYLSDSFKKSLEAFEQLKYCTTKRGPELTATITASNLPFKIDIPDLEEVRVYFKAVEKDTDLHRLLGSEFYKVVFAADSNFSGSVVSFVNSKERPANFTTKLPRLLTYVPDKRKSYFNNNEYDIYIGHKPDDKLFCVIAATIRFKDGGGSLQSVLDNYLFDFNAPVKNEQ